MSENLIKIKNQNKYLQVKIERTEKFIDLINAINEDNGKNGFSFNYIMGTYCINGRKYTFYKKYKIDDKIVYGRTIIDKYLKDNYNAPSPIMVCYYTIKYLKENNLMPEDTQKRLDKAFSNLNCKRNIGDLYAKKILKDIQKLYSLQGKNFTFTSFYGTYNFGDASFRYNSCYFDEESNESLKGETIIAEILKEELGVNYNIFHAIGEVRDYVRNGQVKKETIEEFHKFNLLYGIRKSKLVQNDEKGEF